MKAKDKNLLIYVLGQIEYLDVNIDGIDEDVFLRDRILKDACLLKLIMIGEYSSRVSEEMKNRFSEVEWQLLKASRNYYVHVYDSISWIRVWETLKESLPELKKKIQYILEEIGED